MVAEAPAKPRPSGLKPARPAEERQKAYDLYLSGLTIPQVASSMSLPIATVSCWSARYGWQAARRANALQVVERLLPSNGRKGAMQQLGEDTRIELAKALHSRCMVVATTPATSFNDLANTKDGQGQAAVIKTLADAAATVHGWGDEKTVGIVFGGDLRAFDTPREPVIDAEILDQSVNMEEQTQGVVEPLNIIPPS